jgi:signal transduction histidine kinase
VELHGGCIWADTAGEGKGSTFSFVIPSQAGEENA